MEYLVGCRYVVETAEPENRASYEITEAGRAALKRSEGESA
jgi:DNA-binding PadR family transcriptional regulator